MEENQTSLYSEFTMESLIRKPNLWPLLFFTLLLLGGCKDDKAEAKASVANEVTAQSVDHAEEKYLFFLHNRFPETHELTEAHPEYGPVAYQDILAAFTAAGLQVISEKRNGNVNAKAYAQGVVQQIDSLRALGVRPNNITVVGTSKGGYIAQYVSTIANEASLNFVFIGCFQVQDLTDLPEINYCGNILTIFDRSDPFGVSARQRLQNSTCSNTHFREVELATGLGHGFLFRALDAWLLPTVAWARGEYDFTI